MQVAARMASKGSRDVFSMVKVYPTRVGRCTATVRARRHAKRVTYAQVSYMVQRLEGEIVIGELIQRVHENAVEGISVTTASKGK